MSRVIKFRAFDAETGEFLSPKGLSNCAMSRSGELYREDNSRPFNKYNKQPIFSQFTGLVDKNGVDIYEGDIVIHPIGVGIDEQHCNTGEVRFMSGSFCVATKDLADGITFVIDFYEYTSPKEFEIIGNIYQDSELLDKGAL